MNLLKRSRKMVGVFAALTLVITSVATFTIAPTASATTYFTSNNCSTNLQYYAYSADNYAFLPGNFCIQSQNAKSVFQTDGNLVTYVNGRAVWSSQTPNRGAAFLSLQSDGNVVIYGRNNVPLWNTRTNGQVGSGGNELGQLSNGQLNVYKVTYGSGALTQVW